MISFAVALIISEVWAVAHHITKTSASAKYRTWWMILAVGFLIAHIYAKDLFSADDSRSCSDLTNHAINWMDI